MQNLPTFQRCKFGTCELCGGFSHRGGVMGLVKDRSGQDVMPVRQVFICDPCLEQIGTVEENEQKIKDELLGDCLAPLKGLGKLEQVKLDGSEIKPGTLKPTEMNTETKKLFEDLFIDVHVSFKTDNKFRTEIQRLRKLLEIERSARSDLERIREKFADDPLLRGIYSSSTQYAFDQVTRAIDETFGVLLGEGEDE